MPEQKSKIKTSANAKATADKQKSKVQVKSEKVAVKKEAAVKVSKPAEALNTASKVVKTTNVSLTVDVYGLDGKVAGKISLPKEIFGEEINKKLIAQAVRVYQANKRQGNASTKTRGEVEGSTRKIYRQKGTGNARHGSVRAPIFVKGGIVHGPKPRDFSLELPKKMRRKALFSALSGKLQDGEIKILSGLEKIEPKTKQFASVLSKLEFDSANRKMLLIAPDSFDSAKRASSNLKAITNASILRLNALDVLAHKYLLFSKEAIAEMETYFLKKGAKNE